MASITTIILFFIYLWGFGFTATYFVKKSNNFLERNLMNMGIGLGIFPILAVFLNLIHVPLDWRIFLLISMAFPLYILFKKTKSKELKVLSLKIKIKKSDIFILIVLLLFLGTLFMYTKGAFSYPYLENEDPWGHAAGVKYMSIAKTAYDPIIENPWRELDYINSYMDIYPPAYDVLMGVLLQTNSSINWTMKFFNALIISLGIIFFYFFANQFMGSRKKALFATFVLAMVPCYLSHFVWAHSLVVTLFFPMMYSFERIKLDKKWAFISTITLASVWVSQNLSQPMKLTTMLLIYLVIGSIVYKKWKKTSFIAAIAGVALSFLWWGAMIVRHGFKLFLSYYIDMPAATEAASTATEAVRTSFVSNIFKYISYIPALFESGGTGARQYLFHDFFILKTTNMINNPIGVGVFLTILVLISIVLILYKYKIAIVKSENHWKIVSLFWLIFTFIGVNGVTLDMFALPTVARGPFRVWMLMAIAIALVSAEGIFILMEKGKKFKIPAVIILLVFIIGISITSGYPKYAHNTNKFWPTSGFFMGDIEGAYKYGEWFATLPPDTPVFFYSFYDKIAIGFDAFSCFWCQDVVDFRKDILDKDVDELYSFLKRNKYEYLIIGSKAFQVFGKDEESTARMNEILNNVVEHPSLEPVHQVEGRFVVFKVL